MAFLAAAEMVSLPEKTSVTTPLFQFDDGERWVVESYGGETVLTPGNSGLEVNGQGHSIRIRNRKFQLLRYHSLTGFSLKLQILEGKGNVIPVWKGADGKLVRLAPRPFAPGNATLRWEGGAGELPGSRRLVRSLGDPAGVRPDPFGDAECRHDPPDSAA